MNSFGLGLVLNFTDNATAGMRSATQAFQQMSSTADAVSSSVGNSITNLVASCYALDSVGTTLMNTGESILSVYTNVAQSVIDSGMQMQGYRMQMSALYGSVEAGEAKIQEIKDYAMSSVFDIQSLIPAVTTMKAVGIEAMADITTSSGQHTQKLLDYASDLAAMMPNMRNAYGTGVSAAMGAFKEYIAEGNALSLKRGAGLDILGILGEDKGATIEERTQQVADLIEKLNIVGYTANLAGTPTQRLSNMQDALFNSLTKIADSGVFEKYCDLLEKLSDWVFTLVGDEETFNLITGVLSDTITTLLSPLDSLLDLLINNSNALIEWVKANPKLTKNILLTVAAVGAFLVAGGAFLKLVSSIGMASAGLNFLSKLPSILRAVTSGFGSLILKSLPFVALAGLAYYAWENNLFGIRDLVDDAVKDVKDIFTVLSDALDDFTLSEENYNLAESLGILPLVESLLQLKYYWGFFTEGFKKGFDEFFKSIEETVGLFGIDVSDIFASIGEFLKSLVEIGQEDKWEQIGEIAGKLSGLAVSILAIVKVMSFLKPLFSLFGGGRGGPVGSGGGGGKSTISSMKNMGIMLLGLAALLAVIGLVSMIPFSVPRVLQLTVVIGAIGIVGTIVTKVASLIGGIPVSTVSLGLANIAIIMTGLTAVLAIIGLVSMIPFDIGRVTQLVVVIGIIGVLGAALSAVAALIGLIPVAVVALGLANIAIVMAGLTALFAVMGLASSVANPGDVLAVIVVVTVLGVLGSALTALAALIGLIPFPVVLAGIANIVAVVGALTGLAVVVSEALPTIGENLNSFITSLEPAFAAFQMLQGLDMAGIGSFFDSFGSFMLKVTGNDIASFFTGGNSLADAANQLVDFATISKQAFDVFAQIDATSANGLLNTIKTIGSASSGISSGYNDMYSAIQSSVNSSLSVLNGFAGKGSSIGSSLMSSVASGIRSRASSVRSALQAALTGLKVETSSTFSLSMGITTASFVPLSTGGFVKDTGVALLHPNEVVINDETTRMLNEFLTTQKETSGGSLSSSSGGVTNDYSVTFSAGSVVVQLANASNSELEKAAEKLMSIIERKQQLRAMAVRV